MDRDRVFLILMRNCWDRGRGRGRRFRRRGRPGRPKVCMYVRIRSITLRCNHVSFASQAILSFLGVFFFVDAQAAIDTFAHLQLTTRDLDFLICTEPHLLYDRLTSEEGKDDPHTNYHDILQSVTQPHNAHSCRVSMEWLKEGRLQNTVYNIART